MTCNQYWEWGGSEDDVLRGQAERHLAECVQCQAARRELESSLSRLAVHRPLDDRRRRLWQQVAETTLVTLAPRELRPAKRSAAGIVATLSAVAALALFAVMTIAPKPTTDSKFAQDTESVPLTSPVVTIPLTIGLCFAQIDLDLQATESRLEEVAHALSLVELQRDVQQTLEEARRWSE